MDIDGSIDPIRCFSCGKVLRFVYYRNLNDNDKKIFLKNLKICCVRMFLSY